MKNKLHYSFLLSLSLVGSLLLLHHVPAFTIGPWKIRQVDLLADIRNEVIVSDSTLAMDERKLEPPLDSLSVPVDSVAGDSIKQIELNPCPPGVTCIEDFSADGTALTAFFSSLDKTFGANKKTRIAFYGDSFIEGDVFCGGFRDSLQSVFGGEGVGFVPITSDVAGFRNTIKHKFENWSSQSLIGKRDTSNGVGPAGYVFTPQLDNWLQYKTVKQKRLKFFHQFQLYYKSTNDHLISITSDTSETMDVLSATKHIKEYRKDIDQTSSLTVEIDDPKDIHFYGAAFESPTGVVVDNFSIRGNSGMNLSVIAPSMFEEFNALRDYKLMILQFGLNVVVEDTLNYKGYTQRMIKVINQLKTYFPRTSFLLIGVSDRSTNTSGEFKTMNAIPHLRTAQRRIAEKTGIAFWDLYEAMGGENSMVKLTESQPPLAARDYTHLNFRGGKILSGKLVKALLHEWNNHRLKNNATKSTTL